MSAVEGFLEREIHPTVIVGAYSKALEEIVRITESLGVRNFPPLLMILNFENELILSTYRNKLIWKAIRISKRLSSRALGQSLPANGEI